jgi:hypothetical protein
MSEMTLENLPVVSYPIADDIIEGLAAEYLPLTILGPEDKSGFEAVHSARMNVKKARVQVEKTRVKLKANALEFGRQVDAEAKRLTALIAPIESHLQSEEDGYHAEIEAIKEAEERKRREALEDRLRALAACGVMTLSTTVEAMTEEQFNHFLHGKQAEKKAHDEQLAREAEEKRKREEAEAAERARLQAEQEQQRKAEAERIAKEHAELERIRKQQEAEQAKIEAERKRLAEEKAARERAEELERLKREAEERAKQEIETKRLAAEAEAKRIAALRPDHEKLLAVAKAVRGVEIPSVSSDAKHARQLVARAIEDCSTAIESIARDLIRDVAKDAAK